MNTRFCIKPFEEVEIHHDGSVYFCCPKFTHYHAIGNILENDFSEIWNSERAVKFREYALKNQYPFCDPLHCKELDMKNFYSFFDGTKCTPIMAETPKIVRMSYDFECNIACKMCRNCVEKLSDERLKHLNSKIDTLFIPLLKSTKILSLSGGDPFASRHTRLLIKTACEKCPELKFDFQTNGILCNAENFRLLNVTPERISSIRVSIHASTAETYGKVIPGGEKIFPALVKNLHYLKDLRKTTPFEYDVHFVVSSLNYKEIPSFIDFAKEIDAIPYFWEIHKENFRYEVVDDYFITKIGHPLRDDLIKILQKDKIKAIKSQFSPVLQSLMQ